MPVIMSPKPKRVRVFLKNGQVYEGGAEEVFQNNSGHHLGAVGRPDTLPEQPKKTQKK
jgi:hypothetical protein